MQLLDQQERTGYWVIETDSANVYSWLATSAVKQWRLQSLFNSIAVRVGEKTEDSSIHSRTDGRERR